MCGLAAAGLLVGPRAARAVARERTLSLFNLHTEERLVVEYAYRGRYQPDALRAVNRLFRDHHTGDVYPIDPELLDLLWELRVRMGSQQPFSVVSAYRSPKTNAAMRRESRGVAAHSYHMQGRAVDIYLPDRDLRVLHNAAAGLRRGGVGYYPHAGFVHVDTGPIRYW
jgi:uncharacterized protein YcbK (DUF882 family)